MAAGRAGRDGPLLRGAGGPLRARAPRRDAAGGSPAGARRLHRVAEAAVTPHPNRRRRSGAGASLTRDHEYEQALVARLADAVGAGGRATAFTIHPLRSAGRSRSYVVERTS